MSKPQATAIIVLPSDGQNMITDPDRLAEAIAQFIGGPGCDVSVQVTIPGKGFTKALPGGK